MRVAVLGAGRVGKAIAADLAADEQFQVTVADVSEQALGALAGRQRITTVRADLADAAAVARVVAEHDLAVGAVPGPMGFATLKTVIEAGVNVVDITFCEEDMLGLDQLAKERGVIALVDCGVAPGSDNVILGYLETLFDRVERFSCYVGGLPVARHWPYEYRSVFSPIDVLAEYTRPARLVENGEVVVREALTERELLNFPGVGTLEAFNTDGLRSLLHTCKVPHMKEKTMRFPGHAELMMILRETGFFGEQPVKVGKASVRPLDLTARLLSSAWHLPEGEEDITVMRVEVEGLHHGRRLRRRYDLLDRFDRSTGTTSMARTTGYTCTAALRAVASGLYTTRGVSPPEYLGRAPGCYDFVMAELGKRGIHFTEQEEMLH